MLVEPVVRDFDQAPIEASTNLTFQRIAILCTWWHMYFKPYLCSFSIRL